MRNHFFEFFDVRWDFYFGTGTLKSFGDCPAFGGKQSALVMDFYRVVFMCVCV